MHVERRQLSGAREWIDDAPRVSASAAVLAELRAWAGAEDAAESERKLVRSENLDSARLEEVPWPAAIARERRGPGGVARVDGR